MVSANCQYAGYATRFPLFIRAARHKDFEKLATVTGAKSGDELRAAVKIGYERMGVPRWTDFAWHSQLGPLEAMNLERWDTLT